MNNEHKCTCCGEYAGYIGPNGYLCYACASTIASIHANCLRNQSITRGENVNPIVYNFDACLEACDIKSIEIDKEQQ